jgi:peptidoglycan-associated lipoprotein
MKRLLIIALAALLVAGLLIVAGCSTKKTITQPVPQPEPQAQPEKKPVEPAKAEASRQIPPRETITETESKGAKQAGTGQKMEELSAKIQDIRFDFDKYDVREDAKPILKELAALLSANKTSKVIIEGHCDDRGTNEYNLALGDKRANSARSYLVSLGIPSSRTETVSYGEEKPLCKEENEECWTQNRRAHFVLTEEHR